MSLIYFDTSGTASSAGIFIPRDNLAGFTANTELVASESTISKDCKFLAAFLTTLQSTITTNRATTSSLATALGFTISKGNPIGVQSNIFTQAFTASVAQVVDYSSSTFYPIPVPTSGSNSGRGVLKITDVFPDAVSVASAGSIAEAGVLIPHTEVDAYGAITATNPTNDTQSRQWFAAMLRYLFNEIPIRVNTNTENFSAVITKTLGTVSSFTLPTNALASTNPSTGLDPTKTIVNDFYSQTIQFNIEFLLNEQFRHFEVRTSLNPTFNPVNITRPNLIEFLNVPTSSVNPIESINVRFSEAINLSSFNFNDIFLTRDNGSNLVNNGVTVEYISETIYQIKGLTNLTLTPGTYQLTVDTNGIQNLAGNHGTTIAQTTFSIIPVITLVSNLPPTTTANTGYRVKNDYWLSSSFKTGSVSYGYTLNSVTLRLALEPGTLVDPGLLLLKLYSDAEGDPGTEILSFNVPTINAGPTALYTFTLANPQLLSANTTYWLVAQSSVITNTYIWANTINTTETGLAGWLIGDTSVFSVNQGVSWSSSWVNTGPFQFSVKGA
ncbi:SbsA Ig-like domain-containing protein [Microcystis aeruginosa]